MDNKPIKLEDIIYATFIKQAQVALDSQEFSVQFKNKRHEDRVLIKKKILVELKKISKEIAKSIEKNGVLKGNVQEKTARLNEVIRRCLNEY